MNKDLLKTGNLKYKRGVYNLININSLENTFDYKRDNSFCTHYDLHPKHVRIELDNGFHQRSRDFDFWLYLKYREFWNRSAKTGLAKSLYSNITCGEIPREVNLKNKNSKGKNWLTPHHLVLVQFGRDKKTIVLDVFEGFNTYKKELIECIIEEHNFYYGLKKGAA